MLLNEADFISQKLKNRHKLPALDSKKMGLTIDTDPSQMLGGVSSGGRNGLNHQTLNIMSGDPLETANNAMNIQEPFSNVALTPMQGTEQSHNLLSQVPLSKTSTNRAVSMPKQRSRRNSNRGPTITTIGSTENKINQTSGMFTTRKNTLAPQAFGLEFGNQDQFLSLPSNSLTKQ